MDSGNHFWLGAFGACLAVQLHDNAALPFAGLTLMELRIDFGELYMSFDEIGIVLDEFLQPAPGFVQMAGGCFESADLKPRWGGIRAEHKGVPQVLFCALRVAVVT